jgi:poly-D-alanine transfer protein DltD
MEQRLKDEIQEEMKQNSNKLYIHEEDKEMQIIPKWINVESVETTQEVYNEIIIEKKCDLVYIRIPITSEQSPEFKDFDDLVEVMKKFGRDDVNIVLNCNLGTLNLDTIALLQKK